MRSFTSLTQRRRKTGRHCSFLILVPRKPVHAVTPAFSSLRLHSMSHCPIQPCSARTRNRLGWGMARGAARTTPGGWSITRATTAHLTSLQAPQMATTMLIQTLHSHRIRSGTLSALPRSSALTQTWRQRGRRHSTLCLRIQRQISSS